MSHFRGAVQPFTWAWVEGGGLRLRNDYAAYYKRDGIALPPINQRPRLYGLNAQEAQECPGMVMSPMFHFEPPCFYFSPAEQELLRNALSGETDEELAKILHMAVVSVKKRWTNIYERVETIAPELFPASRATTKESKRGIEKKRTLLYYLRHHLEELRPVELPKTF